MSILFPKLPKPREWDYRPIYYDEDKERRKQRLQQLQQEREATEGKSSASADGEYTPSLHRGSFREAADRHQSERVSQSRKANIRVWIIVAMLLLLFWYFLA